jgi:sarcosine oxidase gamma subunit
MAASDVSGTTSGDSDTGPLLDTETQGKLVLRRAKAVAQQITDRVRTVTADTLPDAPALRGDTQEDIPALPPDESPT